MSWATLVLLSGLTVTTPGAESPALQAQVGGVAVATASAARPAEADLLPCESGLPAAPKKAPPRAPLPASPSESDLDAARWAALGVGAVIQLIWPVVAGTIGLFAGVAAAQNVALGEPPVSVLPVALAIGGAGLGCATTGPVLGVAEVLVANNVGSRRGSYVWPVVVGTTGELLAVGAGIGAMMVSFTLLPAPDMYNLSPLFIGPAAGAVVYTALGLATVWAVSFAYDLEANQVAACDHRSTVVAPGTPPEAAPVAVSAASPQRQRF